jgi:hypothetical protein
MEGSGRGLISGAIRVFACRDWRRQRKTCVNVPGHRAQIWALAEQVCQPLVHAFDETDFVNNKLISFILNSI